jgi:hypothetical protein
LDPKLAQQALDALTRCGQATIAAEQMGLNLATFNTRVRNAKKYGLKPDPSIKQEQAAYIKRLEADLAKAQKDGLTHSAVRRAIINLTDSVARTEPPKWLLEPRKGDGSPGVPTLFASDLHWGEVVHPSQIGGVNKFNLDIARDRMKRLGERAVRLLSILSPEMDYPGIVLILGGDMISGNIHDELAATNELNSMPCVLDLYGQLVSLIDMLAGKFGKVFVPCVSGNHGRDTHKIWSKDRHHTSFDWLLYCFLAKHFEADKRVSFLIPDGPDAYYRIYGHRYLLTHGDQFRGGDGMIGALGPIIRGDHKKRSRNAQINMEYDTLLMGHFHQYIHLTRLIVNGSLKGMDEYAYSNNFGFEEPQQALWLTHPKYGITFRMPVRLDEARVAHKNAWVSVAA